MKRQAAQHSTGSSFPRRRPAAAPVPDPEPPRAPLVRSIKQPVVWVLGVIATALASVLASILTGLVDPNALLDQFNGRPPVSVVSVQRYEDYGWVFAHRLTEEQLQQHATASRVGDEAAQAYLASIGAWPRGVGSSVIMLKSEREQSVKIISMSVEDLVCEPAPTAAIMYFHPEGAEGLVAMSVNLDSAAPEFIDPELPKGTARAYFNHHSLVLEPDEVLPVTINAYAFEKACEWRLGVDTLIAGKVEHHRLDTGDRPFRVAGGQRSYQQVLAPTYWARDTDEIGDVDEADGVFRFIQVEDGNDFFCSPDLPGDCARPFDTPFDQ